MKQTRLSVEIKKVCNGYTSQVNCHLNKKLLWELKNPEVFATFKEAKRDGEITSGKILAVTEETKEIFVSTQRSEF